LIFYIRKDKNIYHQISFVASTLMLSVPIRPGGPNSRDTASG
jgi:hypothetical protein